MKEIVRVPTLVRPGDRDWLLEAKRVLGRTALAYPWTSGLFAMPVQQQLANYVQTTLASGCTNVAVTLTVTSVAGWPILGNFRLRIDDPAPATTFEIVEVTSVNVGANQVTVTRGMEGTTGIAHSAGAFIGNEMTAAMLLLAIAQGTLAGGYAEVQAVQGGITAVVDLTSLAVTVTPLANRRIQITFWCPVHSTVNGDAIGISVQEGATVLLAAQCAYVSGATFDFTGSVVITPTAAAHTYKLTCQRLAGTGTISLDAMATTKAYILAEDIGQA